MTVRMATESELRELVLLDMDMVDSIADTFRRLSAGEVVMPPILSMELSGCNGEVDVKTAYIPGAPVFAVKISPGFFSNPSQGLPSTSGLMVALSTQTGFVRAVFLDNGYLTDIRTAAAGAVAARLLAPRAISVAGIVGTGMQARLQASAAALVREIDTFRVWGRDYRKATICARDIEDATGRPATAERDLSKLIACSQLVVTTTPARVPLIKASWLHPGLHITAMGSDQPGKCELDPHVLASADVVAVDSLIQSARQGELANARAAGFCQTDPPELGAILAGTATGRRAETDITICDLTGTGAQDTAIAAIALARIEALGAGGVSLQGAVNAC